MLSDCVIVMVKIEPIITLGFPDLLNSSVQVQIIYLFIYFVRRLKSYQLLINSHIDDKISGGKERKEVGIIVNIGHGNPRDTSLNLIVVIESKESFSFETNKMQRILPKDDQR